MISLVGSQALPLTDSVEQTIRQFVGALGMRDGFAMTSRGLRHYLFLEPVCKIALGPDYSWVENNSGIIVENPDPWFALDDWLQPELSHKHSATVPCLAGFFGYELLHHIEDVPWSADDNYRLPRYLLYGYRRVVELVANVSEARIYEFNWSELKDPFWECAVEKILCTAPRIIDSRAARLTDADSLAQHSNFSRPDYMAAVSEIQKHIKRGDVYQVNLSQQFILPYQGSPQTFFLELRTQAPSDYSSYLHVGETWEHCPFSVVSSSPELFLDRSGSSILSSPIKGTRPRGRNQAEDELLAKELLNSTKDRAELAMIIDLIRNDLGRIAEIGSVHVAAAGRLVSISNVHHLVGDIRAKLPENIGLVQVIKALFPSGSVTGAPKIAAMKFISALEKTARGVYTGAIGSIAANGDFLLNVAIRTAVLAGGQLIFQAGGGVVIDSDPEAEYQETLSKASGIYGAWLRR